MEIRRTISFAALCIALAGCNSEPEAPTPIPPPSAPSAGAEDDPGSAPAEPEGSAEPVVEVVRIRPTGVRIAPGRPPVTLSAEVLDQNREPLEVDVEWHSLDPDKVSIAADGTLTALGPLGPAFVTASAGDFIAEPVPVYVVDPSEIPVEGSGEGSGAADVAGLDRLVGTWRTNRQATLGSLPDDMPREIEDRIRNFSQTMTIRPPRGGLGPYDIRIDYASATGRYSDEGSVIVTDDSVEDQITIQADMSRVGGGAEVQLRTRVAFLTDNAITSTSLELPAGTPPFEMHFDRIGGGGAPAPAGSGETGTNE